MYDGISIYKIVYTVDLYISDSNSIYKVLYF